MTVKRGINLVVLAILITVGALLYATNTTSVSEEVRIAEAGSDGSVVTVGLSDYKGLVQALAGDGDVISTDGNTLIIRAHEGKTFGYGARLQYTLYGADEYADTFKITAHTNEIGDEKVLIGIYSISDPPKVGDLVSGSLGEINRESAFYNGEDPKSRKQSYEGLFPDGDAPAMFLLKKDEPVDIIVNISTADTWTGSNAADGAWLFYELLEQGTVEVYFTILPQ